MDGLNSFALGNLEIGDTPSPRPLRGRDGERGITRRLHRDEAPTRLSGDQSPLGRCASPSFTFSPAREENDAAPFARAPNRINSDRGPMA